MSEKKLFLLDGHALVYRAHFAFINRPLINSKGINTSAITGFVRTLWDLIVNQKPTHIAVAFDPSTATFRHEYYPEYKANRDAQPEDISMAIPYIQTILDGFRIPILIVDTFEADDVIGTLAKQAEAEGFQVYMVTPDKDYGQLVSENIFMYKPSRQGNGVEVLGVKEILETWEITSVDQVIDSLGLIGDSVDNIPGVPGIGPKTAVTLLRDYGTLENVLANADNIKGKNGERLKEFAEQALLSKRLATIKLDVPIHFNAEAYHIDPMDKPALSEIFKELEFRSLALQILGEGDLDTPALPGKQPRVVQGDLFAAVNESGEKAEAPKPANTYKVAGRNIDFVDHEYVVASTFEERQALIQKLKGIYEISFDTETTNIDAHIAELVGMVFATESHKGTYVPIPANQEEARKVVAEFKELLESTDKLWVGQNIKYDATMMKWYGVEMQGPYFDTMITHYLCEPDLRHKLDYLTESYLNYTMVPIEDLIGKGRTQITMREVPLEKVKEYACEDADWTLQLKPKLLSMIDEIEVTELYKTLEAPLINVLRDMEYEGIKVNGEFLRNYSFELADSILAMEKTIYQQAGGEFNISSPKQVGDILFDSMKIPYKGKKTGTGQYSTDVEVLTDLSIDHQIVKDILEYRKLSKLKSTYVDALPLMVNPRDGRIHSNFNQARAATGRLSSENPNLQNIPIRDEAGREIRKAFEPRDNEHILLAADYSQIELRLIAEISKDAAMLEAFIAGNDFHKATAARVYGVAYDEVTSEQRRNAKTVNFSITYGAGATNLSRQLGIPRTESTELIKNYFAQFQGLKNYMEETVEFARKHGYVQTLLGRKRTLRDINSRNGLARSTAERVAINTPIQGTAADMIKRAMIHISDAFKKEQVRSRLILQVHDELVFDVYQPELEQIKAIVAEKMQNAIGGLNVPILVEMGTGMNWLEAH
ncbi:MAG TPA: DNA polymerase I [Saprospiraceae bacterium]|nr:DNA polymerase I [Saprospiraceae bacterium]HPN70271.1 DNA polymerase I [Saprospiraceae bacterium]